MNFAKNETLRHPFASASQTIDLICAYFDLTTHKHNISQPWNSWKIFIAFHLCIEVFSYNTSLLGKKKIVMNQLFQKRIRVVL